MTHIDLKDKRILLTGASKGIGKEIANYLIKMGAQVAVHYNTSKESAEILISNNKETNSKLFKADLGIESEVISLFKAVEEEFKTIDVIILNAGVFIQHSTSQNIEDWLKVWKKTIMITN